MCIDYSEILFELMTLMKKFLVHVLVVVVYYEFMLSSLMSGFCVKSPRNLNLFPLCSYDSLFFIN